MSQDRQVCIGNEAVEYLREELQQTRSMESRYQVGLQENSDFSKSEMASVCCNTNKWCNQDWKAQRYAVWRLQKRRRMEQVGAG